MTTEEVVKRLVELVNEGKNTQAQEELYHDDVVTYEQDGSITKGKVDVMEKTKGMANYFDALYGSGVSAAFVGSDNFLLKFAMDFTPKGGERMQVDEYGFYKLQDGKVIEEYFYMQPLAS